MKKILIVFLALSVGGALFAAGWHLGVKSGAKLGAQVLKAQMFSHAYSQLAENHVVIEEINSGKIEDAKNMLYMNESGNIFALDNMLQSPDAEISPAEMEILLKIDQGIRSQYGPAKVTTDKLFARIAKFRWEHPWKYAGTMPTSNDPESEAKLSVILKLASDSQR